VSIPATVMPTVGRIDAYPTQRIGGYAVRPGRLLPFGASTVPGGVNFSVYSNNATDLTLVLFRRGEPDPIAELPFPPAFRIGGVYAMTIFGLDAETTEYGYRVAGPAHGNHRFDPSALVLDPYARLVTGREEWGVPGRRAGNHPYRCGIGYEDFDWEDDRPLNIPPEDLVVYEMHVRGFTRHPSSGVRHPGTFAGLAEKIPYLRELGVNCVELMPVFEFDELDNARSDPATGNRLYNYWGYSTVAFFAPKAAYAATGVHGMQADEFKNMVKLFHRSGIEVILDVVFNHTAEGNELGPTISFRGLDNSIYYMLTPEGFYYNYSGTGNTLNCNHPVVRGFILDCLRYWTAEYHIDGFRFDLAAILGRSPDGSVLSNPPVLESLAHDPVLRDCKLIAEAWDAAGLYQVGSFPDYLRWSEWNGRYRDTVRRFIKGDHGTAGDFATRLAGSADLYGRRGATASVNLVTAHDGFTLADLVSYNFKHNEANGEDNRDGDNGNNSWNCGYEGPAGDQDVLALRARQMRNALLILLCSRGIPMLLAGDEAGRSQQGNNNAYCQDNLLSWFDWSLTERNADLVRFVRCAVAFRRAHPALRQAGESAVRSLDAGAGADRWFPMLTWHGTRAWNADWSAHNRLVAAMFYHVDGGRHDCVYIAANSYWKPLTVQPPSLPGGALWHLFADTRAAAPEDVSEPGTEWPLGEQAIVVGERSVVVLVKNPRPFRRDKDALRREIADGRPGGHHTAYR
jgi:isoamylase